MKKEYVWTCDFCGKEFPTKKKSDHHELKCPKKKDKKTRSQTMNVTKEMAQVFGIFCLIIVTLLYFSNPSNKVKFKLPTRPTPTQPVPTSDPDPYTTCSWDKFDDGTSCPEKRMRQSACSDSVCCGLGNGTASPMSKIDCAEFQANIKQPEIIYRQQLPAPRFIQREPIKVPAIEPPNVRCNYDYRGDWVCKPSW